MKFNKKWLEEWLPCADVKPTDLADTLSMAGLEVDAVSSVCPPFSGVVVGEVMTTSPHPDADRLTVCQVAGHPDGIPRQVVCGAPNARAGIKIPFATEGAQLPAGDIKAARLRNVESYGMLCAGQELGLDATEGLWELPQNAPTGADLRQWLQLDDHVIDVDLTPNRGDCLSIRGLARELATLLAVNQTPPTINAVTATLSDTHHVDIQAPTHCASYAGRVIRNINIAASSPAWLAERLRRAGIRSIDPVVDVTNYVMLELGQPMHAFDLANLHGNICVRLAQQGESLVLLDGQTITLSAETLVIADEQQPLAVAGIMGGKASGTSTTTRDIFLESAWFNPIMLAGKARLYGLHTDSSHRFERGVDPTIQALAIERATALLLEITGGEAGPVTYLHHPEHLPANNTVLLRRARLAQQLGLALPDNTVLDILQRLGFQPELLAEGWMITPPAWRFDISIEQDLIEEVARVYGYNNLPTRTTQAALAITPVTETQHPLNRLEETLVTRGYREAITYSFISASLQTAFSPDGDRLALQNPISSDMGEMRLSLLPGLVSTLQQNLNRQQSRVKLFECGLRFLVNHDGLQQQPMLAGLAYGSRHPESWHAAKGSPQDFYDLKGDVEALLARTGRAADFRFAQGHHPALHPGQTAQIVDRGTPIGVMGSLHPELQRKLGLEHAVFLFELERDPLLDIAKPAFHPPSRFPEVRRDLAIIVDRHIPSQAVSDTVLAHGGECLRNIILFDVYCGEHIDPHRKSVALGLTFQHGSRTLNESEIIEWTDRIVAGLASEHNALLRQ